MTIPCTIMEDSRLYLLIKLIWYSLISCCIYSLVIDVMGYILSEPIMPIDVMGSQKTLGWE